MEDIINVQAQAAPSIEEAAPSEEPKRSFTLPKDFRPASVKLDNIEPLTGQQNYDVWSSQMTMVFDATSVYEIVINGLQPSTKASPSDVEGFQALSKHAMLILIQVISKPILKKVSKFRSPHEIWNYLKETYYRDTPFSFVHQIAGLCLLATKYEKGKPVSEFLDRFDDQWNNVLVMSAGSEPYCKKNSSIPCRGLCKMRLPFSCSKRTLSKSRG